MRGVGCSWPPSWPFAPRAAAAPTASAQQPSERPLLGEGEKAPGSASAASAARATSEAGAAPFSQARAGGAARGATRDLWTTARFARAVGASEHDVETCARRGLFSAFEIGSRTWIDPHKARAALEARGARAVARESRPLRFRVARQLAAARRRPAPGSDRALLTTGELARELGVDEHALRAGYELGLFDAYGGGLDLRLDPRQVRAGVRSELRAWQRAGYRTEPRLELLGRMLARFEEWRAAPTSRLLGGKHSAAALQLPRPQSVSMRTALDWLEEAERATPHRLRVCLELLAEFVERASVLPPRSGARPSLALELLAAGLPTFLDAYEQRLATLPVLAERRRRIREAAWLRELVDQASSPALPCPTARPTP